MKTMRLAGCAAAIACAVLALAGCAKGPGGADSSVTVTFDSRGGGSVPAARTLPGDPVDEPVNLTNSDDENLIFSGWYVEEACTTRWDFDDPVEESITLYAKWNAADTLAFAAISDGAAWEVAAGAGALDADLYIPAYYKGIPVTRTAYAGFDGRSGITDLCLPEGLLELGSFSFSRCTFLSAVKIPESVTTIMQQAFAVCSSLEGAIEISENVTSIGDNAFLSCYSMTAINVAPDNAAYSSQDGVLFNKPATTLILYPLGKAGSSYSIPSTVAVITKFAFTGNYQLITVSIPSSLESIGYCAFSNCSPFSYIFIPDSVTSVGESAFGGAWGLTIHCQAASKPDGWHSDWDRSTTGGAVTWGCSE